MRPNWGPNRNPGLCPDRELNWWPFALWTDTQPPRATLVSAVIVYLNSGAEDRHLSLKSDCCWFLSQIKNTLIEITYFSISVNLKTVHSSNIDISKFGGHISYQPWWDSMVLIVVKSTTIGEAQRGEAPWPILPLCFQVTNSFYPLKVGNVPNVPKLKECYQK